MQRPVASRPESARASLRKAPSRNKARAAIEQQTAVSAYITEMSAELARMAGEAKLPMLAYFLNLARVEAEMTAKSLDHAE